jgi:hypothetical protein
MRGSSFVIGAVLIGTAFLVIRPAFAFTLTGEPHPICWQCNVCSAEAAAALREQCDLLAPGGLGIARPVNPNDSLEGLPQCTSSATDCEPCLVGLPGIWICLGLLSVM